jgi:hypothetical protein
MNPFFAALNSVAPHFTVRDHALVLSHGHPFNRVEIDLRTVAGHRMPGPATLRLRQFRGRWTTHSMNGFRPSEIQGLQALLTAWEKRNHQRQEPYAQEARPAGPT